MTSDSLLSTKLAHGALPMASLMFWGILFSKALLLRGGDVGQSRRASPHHAHWLRAGCGSMNGVPQLQTFVILGTLLARGETPWPPVPGLLLHLLGHCGLLVLRRRQNNAKHHFGLIVDPSLIFEVSPCHSLQSKLSGCEAKYLLVRFGRGLWPEREDVFAKSKLTVDVFSATSF